MAKKFHNGTNITAKQYTIFLGGRGGTHLILLAYKIPAF
jgi:hypothetical protein